MTRSPPRPAARKPLREAPPQGLPSRVELKDVPFHLQDDFLCGPATLAMVFNAAGVPATAQEASAAAASATKTSLPRNPGRHLIARDPIRPRVMADRRAACNRTA